MITHSPKNYQCPFCQVLATGNDLEEERKEEIVYQDNLVTALVAQKWWKHNPGHVIIVPNKHFENLYDLPEVYGHRIFDVSKKIAIAFKNVYLCDGTSMRQHNEPAGNQRIWHFHQHIFPRYNNDDLYKNHDLTFRPSPEERIAYAKRLRAYLEKQK